MNRTAFRPGLALLLAVAACGGGGSSGRRGIVLGPDDVGATTDAAGRLVEQRDAKGRVVRYAYDAAGNLTAITVTGPP
jgi:YD repeat-containing protein